MTTPVQNFLNAQCAGGVCGGFGAATGTLKTSRATTTERRQKRERAAVLLDAAHARNGTVAKQASAQPAGVQQSDVRQSDGTHSVGQQMCQNAWNIVDGIGAVSFSGVKLSTAAASFLSLINEGDNWGYAHAAPPLPQNQGWGAGTAV